MNIYHIQWEQGGAFALNACVIANTEEDALKELNLGADDTEVSVTVIGVCTDGTAEVRRVCQESL